jgi:hypothetical protein
MLTEILQRGQRSVGNAVDVDQLMTQRCADLVEIVRGDQGRVEPQVGGQLQDLAAGADPVGGEQLIEAALRRRAAGGQAALQPVRFAGPRWSTKTTSRWLHIGRKNSTTSRVTSLAAPWPGPPVRTKRA